MPARRDSRVHREGAEERRNIHYTLHRDPTDQSADQGLQDQVRPGGPSVITEEISEYLDKMLEDDDKLSAFEFNRLITKKFRVQISATMIRRFLRLKLSWVTVKA